MNSDFVGKCVSLDCGSLGFYQGKIVSINLEDESLSLKQVFKDGKAYTLPVVTFCSRDIKDMNLLEDVDMPEPPSANTSDTSAFSVVKISPKKKSSTNGGGASSSSSQQQQYRSSSSSKKSLPVAEKVAASFSSSSVTNSSAKSTQAPQRAASFKQQEKILMNQGHRLSPGMGGYTSRSSPKKGIMENHRHTPNRRNRDHLAKDEDCFFSAQDEDINEEFDFEKNLALFDKRTVLQEIQDDISSNQPDLVRLVDCNKRTSGNNKAPEPKYRNDENVLESMPAVYRQIETGETPPGEYVTDTGLIVPAVSYELRCRLEKAMEAKDLGNERITELVARAGVELAIQLFGGAHRLNPGNKHQLPLAVVLCGPSQAGVYGMATARHLETQGISTVAYIPDLPHYPPTLESELKLYKLTGGKWTTNPKELPSAPVDLIITSLEDHFMWDQERSQPWMRNALKWAKSVRSPVLAIDPPNGPDQPLLPFKVCLVPGMPLWQNHAANLFMVNLSVPKKIYKEVGIKYSSPFGAKTVVQISKVTEVTE